MHLPKRLITLPKELRKSQSQQVESRLCLKALQIANPTKSQPPGTKVNSLSVRHNAEEKLQPIALDKQTALTITHRKADSIYLRAVLQNCCCGVLPQSQLSASISAGVFLTKVPPRPPISFEGSSMTKCCHEREAFETLGWEGPRMTWLIYNCRRAAPVLPVLPGATLPAQHLLRWVYGGQQRSPELLCTAEQVFTHGRILHLLSSGLYCSLFETFSE